MTRAHVEDDAAVHSCDVFPSPCLGRGTSAPRIRSRRPAPAAPPPSTAPPGPENHPSPSRPQQQESCILIQRHVDAHHAPRLRRDKINAGPRPFLQSIDRARPDQARPPQARRAAVPSVLLNIAADSPRDSAPLGDIPPKAPLQPIPATPPMTSQIRRSPPPNQLKARLRRPVMFSAPPLHLHLHLHLQHPHPQPKLFSSWSALSGRPPPSPSPSPGAHPSHACLFFFLFLILFLFPFSCHPFCTWHRLEYILLLSCIKTRAPYTFHPCAAARAIEDDSPPSFHVQLPILRRRQLRIPAQTNAARQIRIISRRLRVFALAFSETKKDRIYPPLCNTTPRCVFSLLAERIAWLFRYHHYC